MSKCRTCKAEIEWAFTIAGRKMPVDATPSKNGTLMLVRMGAGDDPNWFALGLAQLAEPTRLIMQGTESVLHTSHFATCPDADEHRKS